MAATTKNETIQITFKLDERFYRPLSVEANALGLSPNIAARQYVERGVTGDRSELFAIRDELAAVRSELGQLKEFIAATVASRAAEAAKPEANLSELQVAFATGLTAILTELRPHQPKEEIVEWVKKNLLRKAA